ncbi:MAG: hypothetical protein AB1431_02085, partial [Pseudomonadota bacterium]
RPIKARSATDPKVRAAQETAGTPPPSVIVSHSNSTLVIFGRIASGLHGGGASVATMLHLLHCHKINDL